MFGGMAAGRSRVQNASMKKDANQSLALLASALEKELGGLDVVEPGFHPVDYWMSKWGRAEARTRQIISGHESTGRMTVKKFRIPTANQKNRSVSHWKAVK